MRQHLQLLNNQHLEIPCLVAPFDDPVNYSIVDKKKNTRKAV